MTYTGYSSAADRQIIMPSTAFVVEHYICPTIGCILSTLTFGAPINSLKSCLKRSTLGDLNCTPWAFAFGNTVGWLAYSYITLDIFVFFSNAPGLVITTWLNIGAMKLQYHEELIRNPSFRGVEMIDGDGEEDSLNQSEFADGEYQNNNVSSGQSIESGYHQCPPIPPSSQHLTSHESKVLQILILWIGIMSTTTFMKLDRDDMKFVIGVAVNINLIFFYAAPLSSIVTILRTKNSASIHFWTMFMMTANAFFWCVYGLAIQDYYILLPNGMGLFFDIIQIMLYMCFPHDGDNIAAAEPERNHDII